MKITYDEYSYIMNYKNKHTLQKLFCSFKVTDKDEYYIVESNIKWIIYIITFIPIFIIEAFYAMWDYGLKNMPKPDRQTHQYTVSRWDDTAFERVSEVIAKDIKNGS